MKKWTTKKVGIISLIAIFLIIAVGFGGYKYTKNKEYTDLLNSANSYMENSEYDKAIALFQQSLSYKKDVTIENNIKLAESLSASKKIYDEGIKLMNDKKYLESIAQFKLIGKESDNLYTEAQNMINECTKEYISLNMSEANTYLESNNYDEANKYIAEVFKIDTNNQDAKILKDTIDKKIQEQQAAEKAIEEAAAEAKKVETTTNNIDTTSAESIVRKLVLEDSNLNTRCVFDHEETIDGVKYFVIHVYDNMDDHTATWGWYYVNQSNGNVFDGTYGDLTPIN